MDAPLLNEQQIRDWREKGVAIAQLPLCVYEPVLKYIDQHLTLDAVDRSRRSFGSEGAKYEFPCGIEPIDEIVLSPCIISAVQQLLGENDIRLLQADLWYKIGHAETPGRLDNTDQRIHMDYGTNTLLHVPRWEAPDAVTAIIYYDDHRIASGGTAYVEREGNFDPAYIVPYIDMPGMADNPFFNDRVTTENWFSQHKPKVASFRKDLYNREKIVAYTPGTILFYRHDLWHRGTPLNPGKLRRAHNLAWKKASSRGWTQWNRGWANRCYLGKVESLIARSSPVQRSLLDFPLPGDPYWTMETLECVVARYGPFGFDKTPYLEKMQRNLKDDQVEPSNNNNF